MYPTLGVPLGAGEALDNGHGAEEEDLPGPPAVDAVAPGGEDEAVGAVGVPQQGQR